MRGREFCWISESNSQTWPQCARKTTPWYWSDRLVGSKGCSIQLIKIEQGYTSNFLVFYPSQTLRQCDTISLWWLSTRWSRHWDQRIRNKEIVVADQSIPSNSGIYMVRWLSYKVKFLKVLSSNSPSVKWQTAAIQADSPPTVCIKRLTESSNRSFWIPSWARYMISNSFVQSESSRSFQIELKQ